MVEEIQFSCQCAVGALVAEWILGDGWRDLVTTSSPTTSPHNIFRSRIQTEFLLSSSEKETFSCILIQNSHMPFGSYDRVPSPTPVSAPLGFSNYPSAVSLRSWAGGEHLQINKQNSTPQIHRCMIHQPQHLVFKVKFKMTPGQNWKDKNKKVFCQVSPLAFFQLKLQRMTELVDEKNDCIF